MNIKERMSQIENTNSQKKLDENTKLQIQINKNKLQAETVVNELKILDFLTEIKDNLWEVGEIETKKDYILSEQTEQGKKPIYRILYSLKASWPSVTAFGDEHDGYNFIVGTDSKEIKIQIQTTGTIQNKRWEYFKDDKYVNVECFRENWRFSRFDTSPHHRYFNFSSDKTAEHRQEIQDWLLDGCIETKNKNGYPLTKIISIDRKNIINRIVSKDLTLKDLPVEWTLTPQEKKQLESVK